MWNNCNNKFASEIVAGKAAIWWGLGSNYPSFVLM